MSDKKLRGQLHEVSSGTFSYQYYDVYEPDSDYDFLNERGYQGGGPSWAGIVYGLLKLHRPELLDAVRFDPEGEGLAIWSDSRAPLEAVAELVTRVKQDREMMLEAIRVAEADGEME